MPVERWQNSETGQWYEVEYAAVATQRPDAPRANEEPRPLSASALEPIARPDTVISNEPKPLDPRRARLMARIIRRMLEEPDDAA